MSEVVWDGAYSSAAAKSFAGWSNNNDDGVSGLKLRYSDGDPMAAVLLREMFGNQNVLLGQDRRLLLSEVFVTGQATDPTKLYTGTDWTDAQAIYAVAGPFILTPTPASGDAQPPSLVVRVSAKKSAGAGSAEIRVYSVPSLEEAVDGWAFVEGVSIAANYASFSTTSTSYPASPGWLGASTGVSITSPRYSLNAIQYNQADFPGENDMLEMQTYLVVAATGDGAGNGCRVRALQVWEAAPGV